MMWNNGDWWQYGMGFGFHWVFMIVFWALVIWGAVALFRTAARGSARAHSNSALDILEERYARGELGLEEFANMRKVLGKTRR